MALMPGSPLEYGGVAALLVAFIKLLDVAKTVFLSRRLDHNADGTPMLSQTACQTDPSHSRHIDEMHHLMTSGALGCHWKDRDEVRDYMEAIRAQTAASNATTQAITALTSELRLARNGRNGQ